MSDTLAPVAQRTEHDTTDVGGGGSTPSGRSSSTFLVQAYLIAREGTFLSTQCSSRVRNLPYIASSHPEHIERIGPGDRTNRIDRWNAMLDALSSGDEDLEAYAIRWCMSIECQNELTAMRYIVEKRRYQADYLLSTLTKVRNLSPISSEERASTS